MSFYKIIILFYLNIILGFSFLDYWLMNYVICYSLHD